MLTDTREHIAQVGLRVQAVQPRCSYQTIEDGGALAACVRAGEKIIAAANSHRAQGSLGDQVIYFDAAVVEITRQRIPELKGVVDGRGSFRLRRQLCKSLFEPSSHVVEQRLGACSANGAAFVCQSSLDLLLDQIECGYAMHCFSGDGRVMRLHQVEELAPDVSHAWSFLNRTCLLY